MVFFFFTYRIDEIRKVKFSLFEVACEQITNVYVLIYLFRGRVFIFTYSWQKIWLQIQILNYKTSYSNRRVRTWKYVIQCRCMWISNGYSQNNAVYIAYQCESITNHVNKYESILKHCKSSRITTNRRESQSIQCEPMQFYANCMNHCEFIVNLVWINAILSTSHKSL